MSAYCRNNVTVLSCLVFRVRFGNSWTKRRYFGNSVPKYVWVKGITNWSFLKFVIAKCEYKQDIRALTAERDVYCTKHVLVFSWGN